MTWSWLLGSYSEQIVVTGRQPVLLLLVGLVAGFGFIRTSTRLIRAQVPWWPRNVSAGGVHLHHEFFGVLLMLAAGAGGFAGVTVQPWRELLAFVFGVGAGLVLDEFALLRHLRDVYWSEQGRRSIDAVIVAVGLTGMLLVRALPFGLGDISSGEKSARWLVVSVCAINLSLTAVTAAKGKPWMALASVFVTAIGVIGAVRLATPQSPWARRRYGREALERAARRSAPWTWRKQRLISLIGGSPTPAHSPIADGQHVN